MATINGNDNANTLTGGTAADTLNGLGGDDILIGNAGDDTLNGGTGNDRLLGGRGSDTYLFGQGFGNDVIDNSGGAGSDVDVLRLTNLNANQIRLTRIGNDLVLTVLATGETLTVSQCFLDADHAIDRIQFADGSRWGATEALANLYYAPVAPTAGADVINGNPTDDTLQGLGGNDTLYGNAGNDTLDGGSGNDRMEGGVGNDTYVVDAAGDVVVEASNAGDDQVLASINYTLGNNVERLTLTGNANLNGTGNALANTLVGNTGNNLLDGGGGNDLIQGGDGNDTLQGGAGNDSLGGDAGNDLLDGGAGTDSMAGGSGDDTYVVDQSGDSVSELQDGGNDTVRSSLSYSLGANLENLELTGNSAINGTGNALANRLTGNTGNNLLDGGAGDDLLAGRRGSDTYRYGTNYGNDVIDNSGGASTDVDTVQLVGLNSNNVRFVHIGDDLQMVVLATSQTLTIKNFYLGVDYEIDRVRFDNNVVWNTAALKAAATLPANGAPTSTNDSQTTLEDTPVTLGSTDFGTYSDPENTPLAAVQITSLPALGSLQYHNGSAWVAVVQNQIISKADLDAGKLQFVPALNGNGSGYASIGFKVGDGTAFAVNASTLSINVTPVNDAPTVSGPVSLPGGSEDTAYTITAAQLLANASDMDAGTTLSVQSVSVDSSFGALTNNNNGTWTFAPASNLNGPVTFAVVVTDGSLQVATSAQLNLAPVNDAPVVTVPLWTEAPENSFISTNVSTAVLDPDGDALTYTFAPQSSMGGSVSMFAGNPGAFFYSGNSPAIDSLAAGVQAVDVISFTVEDGHGGSTNGTFEVRLTGTNDAPTVASALLAQNASEDSPFSYTVPLGTFADVDAGDSLGYSASLANGDPLPGWLSFDAASRTFSGTPGNADVGSQSLKVTATDGSGAKVSSSFTLTIGNTNDAPTLQVALFDQLNGLGQAVAYTLPANTFADVDVGDSLVLSARLVNGDPLPAWLVFDAPSRSFSGTPPAGTQPGGIAITVTATDSGGLSVSDDFVLSLLSATVGTPNDDVLNGSVIDDAIYGLAGNDTLNGFGGNDLLDGGSGYDYLFGGQGNDTLLAGDDSNGSYLVGEEGDDVLTGSSGVDTMFGGSGNDTLEGGSGDDTLRGERGSDLLRGGDGNDYLEEFDNSGQAITNTLEGGSGDDTFLVYQRNVNAVTTVVGGSGRDTYNLQESSIGQLVASDFAAGANGDILNINQLLLASNGYSGGNPFASALGYLRLLQQGADTLLQWDQDGAGGVTSDWQTVITLQNTSAATLTLDNFSPAAPPDGSALGLTLNGTPNDDVLNGSVVDDAIYGLAGNDTLNGFGGNDLLDGGSGYDYLFGGQGNDTLLAGDDSNGSYLVGEEGDDVLTGSSGVDTMFGGSGNDTLEGGSGDDTLRGERGSDLLRGGDGNDYLEEFDNSGQAITNTLEGGLGDDTFVVYQRNADAVTTVVGGSGRDTYNLQESSIGQLVASDFAAGANGDILNINQLLLASNGYSGGNPFASALGYLRLLQQGADTLLQWDQDGAGGVTSDWQTVITLQNTSAATLTLDNFSPAAPPDGSALGLTLNGTPNDDVLNGSVVDDAIYGLAGNDTLNGFGGNDLLDGGSGYDYLFGGQGNDTLLAGDDSNGSYLVGEEGDDVLTGSSGVDTMFGGSGNDTLEGGSGDDTLRGERGSDLLRGGDGNDYLEEFDNSGQAITNTLEGGLGDDTFVVYQRNADAVTTVVGGSGRDTYNLQESSIGQLVASDFAAGANGDILNINQLLLASSGYSEGNPFDPALGYLRLAQQGADTLLQWDQDGAGGVTRTWETVITLKNTNMGTLTAANFSPAALPNGNSSGLTLVGTLDNEDFFGSAFADSIYGMGGRDFIFGFGGNDLLDGGSGFDLLIGGSGNDTLLAGDDNDGSQLDGEDGNDILVGSNGNDSLDGSAGNDSLTAGAGNDRLRGGSGDDTLDGGSGNDELLDIAGSDTLRGGDGNDTLTDRDDSGQVTNNSLDAGAGDDTINVYQSNVNSVTTVTGGSGRDTYVLDRLSIGQLLVSDFATGASGDVLNINELLTNSSGFSGGNPFDPALGYLRLVQQGADTLLQWDRDGAGGASNSWQTIITLQNTNAAALTTEQFTPTASSNGSSSGLTLTGTSYGETLNGTAFDDAIYGLAGDDRLNGLDGNDLLDGGNGYDTLYGGQGNDTLMAGNDADGSELRGEQGNDTLTGSAGADRLSGDDGNDILIGGAGNDILSGGAGNDTLNGGDGNDFLDDINDLPNAQASLDAGAGDDTIHVSVGANSVTTVVGGSGRDTYRLEPFSVGQLLVSDFAAGTNGDIIDINQLLFLYGTYSSGNPFDPALGFLRLVQQGADTSLQWDLNGAANGGPSDWQTVITLQNTDASTLTADNFSPAESPEVGVFNLNIEGGAGDDPLTGTASADRLLGHDGNDTLLGLAGDDELNGGTGNDRLDGGAGNDSARYSAGMSQYTITFDPHGYLAVEAGAGSGEAGRDQLTTIEQLHFTDGTIGIEGSAGGETLVNTVTAGSQSSPSVTALAGGGYVVCWMSLTQGNWAAYLQRYDASGAAVGGEVRVNSTTGSQSDLVIRALGDGGFVVSWISNDQVGNGWDVYAQRFDASGAAVGGEVRVNSTTVDYQYNPAIGALGDGGYVVTWNASGQDGSLSGIYAQRYDANGAAVGGEVRVNTVTVNDQFFPSVTGLADGGYLVSWMSYAEDGSAYDINAQRYDASGAAVGGEVRVNTFTANNQASPSVAGLADGGYVVSWLSVGQDGSGTGVFAQRYDAGGVAVGSEVRVNTVTAGNQSFQTVVALADGGYVLSWQSENQDGSFTGVYVQRYDANGVAVGGEVRVNTTVYGPQQEPTIDALSDGGYVVSWMSGHNQDGSEWGIYAQRFDASGHAVANTLTLRGDAGDNLIRLGSGDERIVAGAGNDTVFGGEGHDTALYQGNQRDFAVAVQGLVQVGVNDLNVADGNEGSDTLHDVETLLFGDGVQLQAIRGEVRVNSTTADGQMEPVVAKLIGGGYVVSWMTLGQSSSSFDIYSQRFNASGAPVGDELRVNSMTINAQQQQAIGTLSDGGYVVSWTSVGQDGSDYGIYAQRYDASGATVGDEVRVNTVTANNQVSPSVAGLVDGSYVVSWTSDGQDGSGYGIYAQRYDASGATVGGEVQVNSTSLGNQMEPTIGALNDGGYVVSWMFSGQDGSSGIYAQRYDASGAAVGGEVRVSSTIPGSQSHPVIAVLSDGGYVVTWMAYGQDGSDSGIYAQHYDVNGTAVGSEFRVNSTTLGNQSVPEIAALSGGGYVVTWMSNDQDGSSWGIYAQRFDVSGTAVGGEVRVNSTTQDVQMHPTISALNDGGYVVGWTSFDLGGSGLNIYSQRYDANGNPIVDHLEWTGDATANLIRSTLETDWFSGGAGADTFQFAQLPGDRADLISDFTQGSDVVALNSGLFNLQGQSVADALANVSGEQHEAAGAHLVFNQDDHTLYYDADGAANDNAVAVVTLTGVTSLAASDVQLFT